MDSTTGPWGSLFKRRITNSTEIVERPQTRKYQATGQAVKANATTKIPFWGCPGMNFRASLAFHEMMSAYAVFEKRPPWPFLAHFQCSKVLTFSLVLS
ncbi:MAG: hypothetical protein JRJ69_05260 [Deltaproteobacteria bacterium]|nr:hypothetical protein [Deltaproteobacteria bacterium]